MVHALCNEPPELPRYFDPADPPDRLPVTAVRADEDAVYQAALASAIPWSPLPAEAGAKLRVHLQALDARTAARALALAGLLSLNRATFFPWIIARVVAELPASQRGQFFGYLDPHAIGAAFLMAAFLIGAAFLAAMRPLGASLVALAGFVAVSAPLVWHNPVWMGGGHLGRIVVLLLIGRALSAGIAYGTR